MIPAWPPPSRLGIGRGAGIFPASGFQRSLIAPRDLGFLVVYSRPKQSPHRTLCPWRLATFAAELLSQETFGVSVREITEPCDLNAQIIALL
jgi:hypothetical protein